MKDRRQANKSKQSDKSFGQSEPKKNWNGQRKTLRERCIKEISKTKNKSKWYQTGGQTILNVIMFLMKKSFGISAKQKTNFSHFPV